MEHPLISNIDNLSVEDLLAKVTELNKKLSIAWRLGNHDLCNQLRMAIETYQNKYMQKLRDSHNNTDNDGIIDIT
jgi:hypothetical protein